MIPHAWRHRLLSLIGSFMLFFLLVAFIITCSFLVFFSSVTLSEEDIRAFAPIVFFNAIVLAVLFTLFDYLRRCITVDRPLREILRVLDRLKSGDFTARVNAAHFPDREHGFRTIGERIDLLAVELSGVETLRSDFIANVSHEMKTPLAVIGNYGRLLEAADLPESDRIGYARAVSSGARRLADLVTNILRLNRLENQQIYPRIEVYDLGEQLCTCLLEFESVWNEQCIAIETDIAEQVIVHADAELLSLVWHNLLSNAFKFTPSGGCVRLKLAVKDGCAIVTVEDTGCGMSPEVGAHIFEKFYQGDRSHATTGNGLGLALVRRIIDITGSEISVESAPKVGSRFDVRLRLPPQEDVT